jgi:hypothetical protein
MMTLAFDRVNRVLRVTVSGIFASTDLEEVDRTVIGFLAREGAVRSIYDYTDVETVALPHSRLVQRAQQPAIVRDQRVIVSSRTMGGESARTYGRYQREAGEKDAAVVGSLEEAYVFLGLTEPLFELVEER